MRSLNNKILLEPYEGVNKIKADVSSGFAKISQKSTLVGLKVLADALITHGQMTLTIPKGSIAYFEEEILHANAWSKKLYECKDIESKFILGEYAHVRFISE